MQTVTSPHHHPAPSTFSCAFTQTRLPPRLSHHSLFLSSPAPLHNSGLCKASQVADLFPALAPDIVVREARIEDCWEVAETHCSSFFPDYSFPLDFVLRLDRLVAMLSGFSVPAGCKRTCLVAVIGSCSDDEDFLPRRGPLRQRRSGIAYVSNVAVREKYRRKGIAKKLITKAEAQARSWGCRAIALHCDLDNPGAIKLYKDQGFKCINIPVGAKWPTPRTSPEIRFAFMMKLLPLLSTSV
uniref:N-acetyltransferase domain-containing protein n=1 Tax=Kalanchoe fedtschenkoi TaxID=63787 RepID=A0A7N0ZSG0_KALFE